MYGSHIVINVMEKNKVGQVHLEYPYEVDINIKSMNNILLIFKALFHVYASRTLKSLLGKHQVPNYMKIMSL